MRNPGRRRAFERTAKLCQDRSLGAECHLAAATYKLSCLPQKGHFKGKRKYFNIKRKKEKEKEKETEKEDMAVWSDVAERTAGDRFSTSAFIHCCVSLSNPVALSGPPSFLIDKIVWDGCSLNVLQFCVVIRGNGRESHYHCPFGCEVIRSQQDRARARKPDQEAQVEEEFVDVAAGEPGVSEEPLPTSSSQRQSSSSPNPSLRSPHQGPCWREGGGGTGHRSTPLFPYELESTPLPLA